MWVFALSRLKQSLPCTNRLWHPGEKKDKDTRNFNFFQFSQISESEILPVVPGDKVPNHFPMHFPACGCQAVPEKCGLAGGLGRAWCSSTHRVGSLAAHFQKGGSGKIVLKTSMSHVFPLSSPHQYFASKDLHLKLVLQDLVVSLILIILTEILARESSHSRRVQFTSELNCWKDLDSVHFTLGIMKHLQPSHYQSLLQSTDRDRLPSHWTNMWAVQTLNVKSTYTLVWCKYYLFPD